jgi:sulfide:quinone oxidoreductase
MAADVLIVGGGVAALETVAALQALAGSRVEITLVAPTARFEPRAMSVTAPFEERAEAVVSLSELGRRIPFDLRLGELDVVDPDQHAVRLRDGQRLLYDLLVVATGAVPRPPFPGAITFGGREDAAAVTDALDSAGQLAFVAPAASDWTLPLYELALMSGLARPRASLAVVTAETTPLWIFGAEAGDAIRELLAKRGIGLLTGVRVLAAADGMLELDGLESVSADRAIALPRLVGPAIDGLPHDEQGFLPIDVHGVVAGATDVYAAGDVTAFPLRHGGLATQQADAVAEAIAATAGASVTPKPFQPLVRGLLFTGGAPLYLRSDGAHGTAHRLAHAAVSPNALWWPPAKLAGRYLAALLAPDQPAGPGGGLLHDLRASTDAARAEPENAADLTLMLARELADRGDYVEALHALDSAQALSGGTLALEWQRTRTLWAARAHPPAW